MLDFLTKSQMKGGDNLFFIMNISVTNERKFFSWMVTEPSLTSKSSKDDSDTRASSK